MGLELPYLAAILWSWVGVWALAALRSLVPPDFFRLLEDFRRRQLRKWSLYYEFDVPELSGATSNDLYKAVHLYVSSRSLQANAESLVVERPKNASKLVYELGRNQFISDEYRGHKLKWERRVHEKESRHIFARDPDKSYRLLVSRNFKEIVPEYFEFLLEQGKRLDNKGPKKLYANLDGKYWASAVFNPPATFDTLAMDPEVKQRLLQDLTKFLNGERFYRSVGRAWKRGYLLHGPPGTGKSSLIAAIANFTGYDVYDLELTKVHSNTELRQLLSLMKNRAIVVVEDIDCSVDFKEREVAEVDKAEEGSSSDQEKKKKKSAGDNGITLSGLLNFTDGLWSCTGSERIFVFTTNCMEKLDAALLRPGRMDMHISMSYCSFAVFRDLAASYLGLGREEEHGLLPEISRLLKAVNVTPAQVIEVLLQFESDADSALRALVAFLREKAELLDVKQDGQAGVNVKVRQDSVSEEDVSISGTSEDGSESFE